MPERKTDNKADKRAPASAPGPWRVPVAVADVAAETGAHFALTADAQARAAIARVAEIRELPRLDGLHVVGEVSATVGQNCVVTLEPLVSEIEEKVDLVFSPPLPGQELEKDEDEEPEKRPRRSKQNLDGPEPLLDGAIDLGALAIEFLILGIDPYPRKPGAKFEPPQDVAPDPGPFAALAGLAVKDRDGH
jgi:hypothetical protein